MLQMTRPRGIALVALAGVSAALTIASITDASSESTTTSSTSTTADVRRTRRDEDDRQEGDQAKIVCRARLVASCRPGRSAENYGRSAARGWTFGDGVQHDTARLTRTSDTAGIPHRAPQALLQHGHPARHLQGRRHRGRRDGDLQGDDQDLQRHRRVQGRDGHRNDRRHEPRRRPRDADGAAEPHDPCALIDPVARRPPRSSARACRPRRASRRSPGSAPARRRS